MNQWMNEWMNEWVNGMGKEQFFFIELSILYSIILFYQIRVEMIVKVKTVFLVDCTLLRQFPSVFFFVPSLSPSFWFSCFKKKGKERNEKNKYYLALL